MLTSSVTAKAYIIEIWKETVANAEVFTVAENISKNLNLKLEKSDRVLSSLNDSPLSILGKHVRGTLAEQAEVYKGISLCA